MSNAQESSTARPPQRILLVDDDELELELMADRRASRTTRMSVDMKRNGSVAAVFRVQPA